MHLELSFTIILEFHNNIIIQLLYFNTENMEKKNVGIPHSKLFVNHRRRPHIAHTKVLQCICIIVILFYIIVIIIVTRVHLSRTVRARSEN